MLSVRILNIIIIAYNKINLSFEYIKRNKENKINNLTYKTNEEDLNIDFLNKNEYVEIFFCKSFIQFNDIRPEQDFINIFIEINKIKLVNLLNNSNFYFLLNLKNINDINIENKISLKIENLFIISFNSIIYNYSIALNKCEDNSVNNSLDHSMVSIDSNSDYDSEDNIDTKEDMKTANNLFGRIKSITKLIKFKNTALDELKNKRRSDEIVLKSEKSYERLQIPKTKEINNNKIESSKRFETFSNIKKEDFKEISIKSNTKKNKEKKLNLKGKDKDKSKFKKEPGLKKDKDKIVYNSCTNIFKGYEKGPNHFLERKKRLLNYEEKEDFENILSTTNYDLYLKEQNELKLNEKDAPIRETFCSGFFITSFPQKNASIIEKSELFPAPCSHHNCSILKSMKPEIIMKYPLKDTEEVEITNMAATLCFPSGIKLCHCENELRPNKMKDYLTLLTNRQGDRLYIMTYHFYLRMKTEEFYKKYEKYPLKYKLCELNDKLKNVNFQNIDKDTYNAFEEMKICKEFEFRPFVYIPYCLALISKYPYVDQMKETINCIFKIIENKTNENNLELNELIMYLIHSIPIPNINSIIKFPLPYSNMDEKNGIITIEPPKFKDFNILNCNICELLKLFRIKNIIRIFRLLLFEKKIVFIDNDYSRLSNVINSFLSLIYPFQWVHVYIPILTIPMIKYLESFLPFIIGVHSSFIPHIKKIVTHNSNENEQIYLIFIEDDKIRISDFFKGDSKKINKTHFLHKNLINIPCWMYILLDRLLTNIKSKMKIIKNDQISQLNNDIQNAFIEIFVEMFADYNKYIYQVGEDTIFNKKLFMSKRSVFEKNFYKEFLDTQMFLQFKEEILGEGFEYFKWKVSQRNNDYNKEKLTILEKTRTVVSDSTQEEKIYLIKHQFKNVIKNDNDILNNEENYIITYLNNIENEKYDTSKCIIYLMPTFQTIGVMVKEIKSLQKIPSNESKIIKNKTEEERKAEIQIEKIKEQIKDYILQIFKSDINKNDNDFKNILKLITQDDKYRGYFIKLISKNLSKVVILPKNSFDTLFQLIYEILLILMLLIEVPDNLYKDAVLLVKSTMNYGKEEKSKVLTIWDLCKTKLMETPFIFEQKFWNEWYIFEINNNMNLNGELLNDVKSEVMISISKTMKELKIDNSIIVFYTNNLMKKYFDKNLDLINETQKDILDCI